MIVFSWPLLVATIILIGWGKKLVGKNCTIFIVLFPQNWKNPMVLKGAFLPQFSSEFRNSWVGLHLNILVKNPGMKEIGQTVSEKARTTIVIVVKLITSYAVIRKSAR